MWLRLLTVAMVLSVAWPLIRPTLVSLLDQFFKMSAADTEVYLGVYPRLPNTGIGPDREVHCGPGSDPGTITARSSIAMGNTAAP